MTQVLLLGLAGSLLGVALAAGVVAAVPSFAGELATLFPVDYGLKTSAVLQGIAVGVLVSMLFSLVPLLEVRHVKPSLLLRQDIPPPARFDWVKWAATAGVGASLVGVASWQAGSLSIGLLLCGGFVATAFVLHMAGLALVRAVQPLKYARSFALRQAVLHVDRPGNQTRVILLAVGLGAFFILGVRGLQANLLRDFTVQVGPDAPDMFLIDIQPSQRDALVAFLDRANGDAPAPRVMPITPSVAMNGGSLTITISAELIAPAISPIEMPATIAGASPHPASTNKPPHTTPASAITAPGARSIPPEMMTIAAPTAAMP